MGVGLIAGKDEPEIGNAGTSVQIEEHVVRFEVAMHQSCRVSGGEASTRVDELPEHLCARPRRSENYRLSVPPTANSIAMNSWSCHVPTSWTLITLG